MLTLEADRSLEKLVGAYFEFLRARRYSKDTERQARYVLRCFFERLRPTSRDDVRQVDEADIVDYRQTLHALAASSRRAYLVALRSFFAFLVRRRDLLCNPAQGLTTPRINALPRRVPSQAQVLHLLREAGSWSYTADRDRAIFEVRFGSGLRRSECVRLDVAGLRIRESTLWVRNGKGRKDRVVPITMRASMALIRYLRDSRQRLATSPSEPALFLPEQHGRRFTASGLAKVVRRAARIVGVDVSPHSLRHACATHLLQGGADVRQIQRFLGHKRLATTALYTRVEQSELAKMIRRCHPRERGRARPR